LRIWAAGASSAPPVVGNAVRQFVASARPGSRLPHGWIDEGGVRRSTLDLVVCARWTLLVAPDSAWKRAVAALALPLRVVEWGRDCTGDAAWWTQVAELAPDGALLVRPDQHVAARLGAAPADAGAVLERAVRALTALEPAAGCS
jgi:hypothetical protein